MTRDKGSGSVYQDADGRWRASIEAGYTKTGSRRRIKVSAATKTAAQTKLKQRLRQIAESGIPEAGTASMTVKAWSDIWLKRRAAKVRPKAQLRDASCVRRWIVPTIGQQKLAQLSPAHVRSISEAMIKAKRSSSSARRVQSTLAKMLKDAAADGYQVPPRVRLVEKPVLAVNDRQGLSAVQSLAMLTTASDAGERSRWGVALMEAMRSGEARGLTWLCLDLDAAEVDVSWQLQDLPYKHGCDDEPCKYKRAGNCPQREFDVPEDYEYRHLVGAWCLVRPKTSSGQRILPLIPWVVDALREWRKICPESPHDLVWPNADGAPREPDDDLAIWRELQTRAEVEHPAGRPYYVHEARHATATLLMAMKVPESVRIAIMGHAGIRSTRNYEHSDIEMAREALEAMAERVGLTSASRPELVA